MGRLEYVLRRADTIREQFPVPWGHSEAGTALHRASAHLDKGKVSKGSVWD